MITSSFGTNVTRNKAKLRHGVSFPAFLSFGLTRYLTKVKRIKFPSQSLILCSCASSLNGVISPGDWYDLIEVVWDRRMYFIQVAPISPGDFDMPAEAHSLNVALVSASFSWKQAKGQGVLCTLYKIIDKPDIMYLTGASKLQQ